VKFAQAVVSQTRNGQWKIFVQSDRQIEKSFVGPFDAVIAELREYSGSDWEKRGL
jgi:hypothetical protein